MQSRSLFLGSVSLAVLCTPLAFAQETAPATPADEARTFDKVIITAQKREQSLQDVPIVVTAIDGQLLRDAGVRDIKDLTILTPGLLVTSTSNESVTTARIRGVGTVGDNPGLESSVGVVIDGVARARNGVGFGDLGELERVEVLKGPQGTLFGKSTSAGVINVISKGPEREFGVGAALTAGNYGLRRAEGYITGPMSDSLSGRFYGVFNTRDGYLDINPGIGPRTLREDNDSDYNSFRGQLLWEPDENFSMRVILDSTDRDENCCAAPSIRPGPTQALINGLARGNGTATRTGTQFDRVAFSNRDTSQQIAETGGSVEVNWDVGFGTLTSVTARRDWKIDAAQDSDFSGADIWFRQAFNNSNEFENFSQEFRVAGTTGNLEWLVGSYYATEELERIDNLRLGTQYYAYFANGLLGGAPGLIGLTSANSLLPNDGTADVYQQEANTFALFTNNTLSVSDKLDITLGVRWTLDEKSLDSRYTTVGGSCTRAVAAAPGLAGVIGAAGANAIVGNLCLPWVNNNFNGANGAPLLTQQSFEEGEWSGTLKGAYRFNDLLLGYLSYSRGYKAAGYNLDRSQSATGRQDFSTGIIPVSDTFFPAETADSYELGWKINSPSGRLSLNGAYFNQTFSDFQLNTFLGTSFIVTSIPEVTSTGVDADVRWSPEAVEGLSFQGGVTYAKTEYGGFTPFNAAIALLPNSTISFAPEWSTSGAVSYTRPVGNLVFSSNLSGRYVTEYSTASDLLPAKDQEGFALFNGRIALGSGDGRWTIELWGQNLLDEDYLQVGFNGPLQGSVTTPPTGAPRAALVTNGNPIYDPRFDTITYQGFLGAPRTYGVTLSVDF